MNTGSQRLPWYTIACLCLLLQIIAKPAFGDLFYKEIQLGPNCTFEIPRTWNEGKIGWELPPAVKKVTVDFKADRYTGKEVVLDVSFLKSTKRASVDGAVRNGILQTSSQPGISDFQYNCSNFFMPSTIAKMCLISYKKNRLTMHYQILYVVPNNDPFSAYNFTGGYNKSYSKQVIDKVFGSIRMR